MYSAKYLELIAGLAGLGASEAAPKEAIAYVNAWAIETGEITPDVGDFSTNLNAFLSELMPDIEPLKEAELQDIYRYAKGDYELAVAAIELLNYRKVAKGFTFKNVGGLIIKLLREDDRAALRKKGLSIQENRLKNATPKQAPKQAPQAKPQPAAKAPAPKPEPVKPVAPKAPVKPQAKPTAAKPEPVKAQDQQALMAQMMEQIAAAGGNFDMSAMQAKLGQMLNGKKQAPQVVPEPEPEYFDDDTPEDLPE